MDILASAREVFDKEVSALKLTEEVLDEVFEQIVKMIMNCSGKVIITGMGKSGHVGRKIAATFSSLGTSSFFLDPAEAMHGDLGMVSKNDIVIMISYSGESNEIREIIPGIKYIGAKIIAITGNADSSLSQHADITQILPRFEEACHMGLAPTSSTTAVLTYGDALAVTISRLKGFKDVDFGVFHPSGALGKSIIYRVEDLMAVGEDDAFVYEDATLKDVVTELTEKKLGLVTIKNEKGLLCGVITTGDFERQLAKEINIYDKKVSDVMTRNPIVIKKGKLAVEALNIMKSYGIYSLPVVEGDAPVGTINMKRILNAGIVG